MHLCYYYSLANRPTLVIYGKGIMNQPLAVLQYSSERSSRPISLTTYLFVQTHYTQALSFRLPESVSKAARPRFIYQPPLCIMVTSSWQERHSPKTNGQIWLVRCSLETMAQFMGAAMSAIVTNGWNDSMYCREWIQKPQSKIGNADLIAQLPLIANELKATKIILR